MGGRGQAQFIGAAGQHYVAYCLGVRYIHAGITLGNVPDVDLIVAKPDGSAALSLQVKTSRGAYCHNHFGKEVCQWPVGEAAVNRCSDRLWYAFVDLQELMFLRGTRAFFGSVGVGWQICQRGLAIKAVYAANRGVAAVS